MPRILLLAVPALALAGAGIGVAAQATKPAPAPIVVATDPPATPTPATIVVDVSGAVARPGVVRLPAGARVIDALLAAGGMTGDADLAALNKAAPLRDGVRVYVPRPGEQIPAGGAGASSDVKVDINHASAGELQSLPGIGPSTAAKIVRSREAKAFARIEELQTRDLVTPRVFADIKDLVTTR